MNHETVKEITKKLEKGVREIFTSDNYTKYLCTMSKFHQYSMNNAILIFSQCPNATCVAGYKAWETKFNRHVKQGEHAIRILAPIFTKRHKKCEDEAESPAELVFTGCKVAYVFDISQTEGDDLPELPVTELNSSVNNYMNLREALIKFSTCHITFEMYADSSYGYYQPQSNKIVIKSNLSNAQTIKTLVHEIAHSLLHEHDRANSINKNIREIEAESVAYVVCNYLGIDASDYSFGYVVGWSDNYDINQLRQALSVIQCTANRIIDGIEPYI